VSEEWPSEVNGLGSEIRDNYSCMLGKNSLDIPWMMFYFLRENSLPNLTDVTGRMTQMTQFVS
jgi:hypothetical protein